MANRSARLTDPARQRKGSVPHRRIGCRAGCRAARPASRASPRAALRAACRHCPARPRRPRPAYRLQQRRVLPDDRRPAFARSAAEGECRHRARSARRRRTGCRGGCRAARPASRASPRAALRAACRHCPARPRRPRPAYRLQQRRVLPDDRRPAFARSAAKGECRHRARSARQRRIGCRAGCRAARPASRARPRAGLRPACRHCPARPRRPRPAYALQHGRVLHLPSSSAASSGNAESCTGHRRPAFARSAAEGECRHRARSARPGADRLSRPELCVGAPVPRRHGPALASPAHPLRLARSCDRLPSWRCCARCPRSVAALLPLPAVLREPQRQ
jgi:hypothetical protein